MKHDPIVARKRKSVNLSLDVEVVDAAKSLGINLSQVSEAAIRRATKDEAGRRWKEENRDAIARFNEWYERNGDPLAHLASL